MGGWGTPRFGRRDRVGVKRGAGGGHVRRKGGTPTHKRQEGDPRDEVRRRPEDGRGGSLWKALVTRCAVTDGSARGGTWGKVKGAPKRGLGLGTQRGP